MKCLNINFSKCEPVDFLWPELIERFGFDKSKKIISQAKDIQRMHGTENITMPIIFTGTGGLALILIDLVKKESNYSTTNHNQVLIYNQKRMLFQLLCDTN